MGTPAEADILIFAPVGRDAALTHELLSGESIASRICGSVDEVCQALERGAAALILTEEVFDLPAFARIAETLRAQPAWSDTAVLLFAGADGTIASGRVVELMEVFPNVTMIERPVRLAVALSVVRAAIRGRARQLEVRDLLEALRAERQRVEEASRLKDEFLAMLSHELRTPLNAILGWASMLRHGGVEPGLSARGLEAIERNARAQAQLVEDVLDMARVITGKLRIELAALPIGPAVDAAVEAARPSAAAKGIRLNLRGTDTDCLVRADAERLQQILWNLLSNAVKFTPAGGSISVRLSARKSVVAISVADSGVGIDTEFLPHVFDRFRQADQSVTRGHGGLGLGLSIVKHLVELHGGRVEVFSEGRGRGTRFTVLLPVPTLATVAESPDAGDNSGDAYALRFPGRRILVVDDDAATRGLLAELFTRAGAEVALAPDAMRAFEIVEEERPDVIIADIGMPGEDGHTLMRRIRRLPPPRGAVPAIALSAYTRAEDRASSQAAGFSAFVGKPADPQDLLQAVERLLGSTTAEGAEDASSYQEQ